MTKLTKRYVDSLTPTDKDYFIWDDQVKGFGVRVFPSGAKRYIAQTFRLKKTTRVVIGKYGTLAFEEARNRAKKIINDIDDGINPNDIKKSERQSPTITQLAERFQLEYIPSHCKKSTQVEYLHALKKYILPALGTLKVLKLTRDDVSDMHHAMRDTPYQANRTLGVLSKMLNQAEVWGYRPDRSNPCYHVKKYKEQKRERYLLPDELICLRKVFEDEEKFAPSATNAFRLLIFTGARLSEIQTLKWSYIQGDRIMLPDSKTGSKTLHFGKAALGILGQIERIEGNPYVITGKQEGAHLTDMQKPWRRIRKSATVLYWRDYCDEASKLVLRHQERDGMLPTWQACQDAAEKTNISLPTGLSDIRIHDLRHTFASGAVMMGESLPMIGKLLGHTQPQTTARYAHLADDPLRSAVQRIDAMLEKTMMGE
ncbi:MAG: site-specific integrase [Alphaproteobacteria bacterium]|nr:site-specific integrase [Alphaproteobacteria bacterium]